MEFSDTQTLSKRLFRKKLLPVADIDYEGRKIEFTPAYLNAMVEAFNDGAYDNVPLQFADAKNSHTNDPERHRGDVVAMTVEPDGLYVTVSATPEGAKVLQDNPKLGVSARIMNDYTRADGKHYNASVQHILATHDPRITGLGPWSVVENYANENDSDTIDLTAKAFTNTEEKLVPDNKPNELTDAEFAKLRAILDEYEAGGNGEADDELTDAELEALIAEVDAEVEAELEAGGKEPELVTATLSNEDKAAIELARSQATELSRIRGELDEQRWQRDREMFIREFGMPPAVIDMAAPVLKGTGHVIDLANGDKVDAGDTMRKVLTEIGKQFKLLDLGTEMGSSVEGDVDTDAVRETRDATTKAVRAMMGN